MISTTTIRSKKVSPNKLTKIDQVHMSLPTPYIITDLSVAKGRVLKFKKALPNVEIYYAVKANNDQRIINCIDTHIAGYDAASLGEVEQLLRLGVSADRVMFSNPVKIPSHIEESYKKGVRYFAFDSLSEIQKIASLAPGSNVYLRLKVSDYGSKFPLSGKFGLDALHSVDYCSEAVEAGLNVKGITFHVGSQSENIQVWEQAIKITGEVISNLRKKGIEIEFLDLGGGFPADYGNPIPTLNQIAAVITRSLDENIPKHVRVIAEPGRYIAANTSTTIATVIGREHRSGADWLYLDIGAFQGLMEPLEMPEWKYPITTDKDLGGYKRNFVLTGPSCDAYDTIGVDYLLPSDTNVGDKIYKKLS